MHFTEKIKYLLKGVLCKHWQGGGEVYDRRGRRKFFVKIPNRYKKTL